MFLKLIFVLSLMIIVASKSYMRKHVDHLESQKNKFMYFAYGTDMLPQAIQKHSPNAVKIGAGEVKDYRIDFNQHSEEWGGARVTIVPENGSALFGTMWHLDVKDIGPLDRHNGVGEGIYFAFGVPAEVFSLRVFARTYMLADQPIIPYTNFTDPPPERRPSKTLLQCLVKGAGSGEVNKMYINYLKRLQHNGKVIPEFEKEFDLQDVEIYT